MSEDCKYSLPYMAARRSGRGSRGVPGGNGFLGVIQGGQADSNSADPQSGLRDDSTELYAEDQFLAASYDRGVMEPITFKVPEMHLAWARLIVESRRYPALRTKSDLCRLGFSRVLAWLSSLDPGPVERSVMHQIAQMEEIIAWEMHNLKYINFIDQFATMVAGILALPRGRAQVGKVLRRMKKHFSAMEEGFYKTYAEQMFNDRFGAFEQAGLIMVEVDGEDEGGSEGAGDVSGMVREIEELLHMPVEEEA